MEVTILHLYSWVEVFLFPFPSGSVIVPKLYYFGSSTHGQINLPLGDEPKMYPLELQFPFQWAQALYVVAKLLRKLLAGSVHWVWK